MPSKNGAQIPGVSNQYELKYVAKSLHDGATAAATYKVTLHDQYEDWQDTVQQRRTKPGSWRRHPNTDDAIAREAGRTLTVNASQSHTWTAGLTFTANTEASIVVLSVDLGIEASHTREWTAETGLADSVSDVNKDWGTYLQICDLVDIHTGTIQRWSAAGFVGEENYQFYVPVGRGYGAAPLRWYGVGAPVGPPTVPPTPEVN